MRARHRRQRPAWPYACRARCPTASKRWCSIASDLDIARCSRDAAPVGRSCGRTSSSMPLPIPPSTRPSPSATQRIASERRRASARWRMPARDFDATLDSSFPPTSCSMALASGLTGRTIRPHPLNVYGASKLEGERRIARHRGPSLARSSAPPGCMRSQGSNFLLHDVAAVSRAARRCAWSPIRSVRPPAPVRWRNACGVPRALPARSAALCHFTDAGAASWYDFAVAISRGSPGAAACSNERSRSCPSPRRSIRPPARRPALQRARQARDAARDSGCDPVHWRVALREVLQEIQA